MQNRGITLRTKYHRAGKMSMNIWRHPQRRQAATKNKSACKDAKFFLKSFRVRPAAKGSLRYKISFLDKRAKIV